MWKKDSETEGHQVNTHKESSQLQSVLERGSITSLDSITVTGHVADNGQISTERQEDGDGAMIKQKEICLQIIM